MRDYGGKPEATVWIHGGKLPAPNAAYINSCMTHALDIDDVHLPASLHIMSSVLPVALAATEITGASGMDVLMAVIMGVEIGGRVGMEYKKRRRHGGFLDATVAGGYGTTVSACRLYGMSVDETVDALGLYHSQNCGNRQALYDHTLAKRIQPGWAARNALWAADLAQRGVSGAEQIFEGSCNLFRVFAQDKGDPPTEADMAGPQDYFHIEHTSVKRFASCGAMHAVVQAALDLAEEHDLKPDDIDRVRMYLGEGRNAMVGGPWEMGRHPQVDAQFCAAYCVALALLRRTAALDAMTDEAIREDAETQKLADRVELVTHWEMEKLPPTSRWQTHVPQIVQVHTKSGEVLECRRTRRDVFDTEATPYEDVAKKFCDCVEFSKQFTQDEAKEIVGTVWELEKVADAASFITGHLVA